MDVTVGIVAQRENQRATQLAADLCTHLEERGIAVIVDEETGSGLDRSGVPVAEMTDADLVVSIGGDGTFLFVAREAGSVPIVGVNLGEVGFLNAVAPSEALDAVSDLVDRLERNDPIDTRRVDRLHASGDDWALEPALNEVVIHGPRRGPSGGGTVEVTVDGDCYTHSHADGVLVATPTGSTAYNLSEGGPLVRPGLDVLVVTQMCATDPMPPLVVDADSDIAVELSGADHGYAIADGRNRQRLELPTTITIGLADDPVYLAGPPVNFFDALEKLE